MSISPIPARRASPGDEGRRTRLVILLATLGICAALLAYAISPSVRHAVGHAAHSVKSTVSKVLDHDTAKPKHTGGTTAPTPATATGGTSKSK